MTKPNSEKIKPAYQRIKDYIHQQIKNGSFKAGSLLPSEEALVKQFKVSRMTVNRAMRELSNDEIVQRAPGKGTFVSEKKSQTSLVELKNIADEISARGNQHTSELYLLERIKADVKLSALFNEKEGLALFHSIVVHHENGQAIQYEDRYVKTELAPNYMQNDFSKQTANAYLMKTVPVDSVEFSVEACIAPKNIRELLSMQDSEPCLVIHRKVYSQGQVAVLVTLWHPASRYRLTGGF